MTERSYGMYLAYFTLAVLGFNALLAVYFGFGFGSALAGLLIAVTPFLVTRYTKIKFPWFVYFLICLAVLIHISGYIQGRYLNIPNWYTLAHTVAGSILALLGFILVLFMDKIRKYNLDPLAIAAFTAMFGMVGEYLWEIYEFLVDIFLGGLIYDAMAAGHGFVGYDLPGSTRGFIFKARGLEQSAIMGDEIRAKGGVTLQAHLPKPAEIRLFKDGKVIRIWKNSYACAYSATEPGVYRVEVWKNYLGLKRGWIFSNPIYVR